MNILERIKYHLLNQLPLVVMLVILSIVCVNTYNPGTWLSGWDTLHPELNLSLYTERVFFGAWQEHQGLGAPASQAHLAELPRLPLLFLLEVALPSSAVRYTFFFLMYFFGALGSYIYITQVWLKNQHETSRKWAGAIAGLFYCLNLGTLQHFYVPLEMFAVHFASIGFILWSIHLVITNTSRRNLFVFFILQFLSSPSAHTATLFYMYMVLVGLYTLILVASSNQPFKTKIHTLLSLALLVVLSHFYWIIPNLYYVIQHNDYVKDSHISQNFSSEAFWQNQAFGTLPNVSIFKNFLFNWQDYDFSKNTFVDLFDEWQKYLYHSGAIAWSYILSIFALSGMGLSFRRTHRINALPILTIFLISLFFLINLNPPFTVIFEAFRKFDILEEALRFPFTKFSILLILATTTYLAIFVAEIISYFQNHASSKYITGIVICVFLSMQIVIGWPALQGNLISNQMKVSIPNSYQKLYAYTNSLPREARIAKLPASSYWGWVYHNWPKSNGYQGAGFTWFGITQPTLDREFDRWAASNQTFYGQLSAALYNQDVQALATTLQTYDVKYLLLDESVINPGIGEHLLLLPQTKKMLTELGINKIWKDNFLTVYEVPFEKHTTFVRAPQEYVAADLSTRYLNLNPNQLVGHNFIQTLHQPNHIFPFSFLAKDQVEIIDSNEEYISVTTKIKTDKNKKVELPSYEIGEEFLVYVSAIYTGQNISLNFQDQGKILINQESIFLPNLINQTIPAPADKEEVMLVIGSLQVRLNLNQPQVIPLTLEIGDEFTATAVDSTFIVDRANNIVLAENAPVEATFETAFDPSIWKNVINFEFSQNLSPGTHTLTYQIPKLTIAAALEGNTENCDIWKRGKGTSVIQHTSLMMIAEDHAAICTGQVVENLSTQHDYLLEVKGRNIEGRSIKFYVANKNNDRNQLEYLLNEDGFHEFFTLLGTTNLADNFYSLHWETRSFGQKSQNELQFLHFYPLPLKQVTQLKIADYEKTVVYNTTEIVEGKRIHNFFYFVRSLSSDTGIFSLSQTYDPAWIAVARKTSDPFYQLTLLPHYQYNGWANAWEVPPGEHKIVVIYWPQLLSFAGYGLLLGTFGYFAWMGWRSRSVRQVSAPTTTLPE